MIFVLRLNVIDKHLRMLMLSFLFVILCGPSCDTVWSFLWYCVVLFVILCGPFCDTVWSFLWYCVVLFVILCRSFLWYCVVLFSRRTFLHVIVIVSLLGSKLSIFLAFCVVFSMLPVSLECRILITPSVFSNFYVYMYCR
jgi:hypothetical protein